MSLRINHNISAINTHRRLLENDALVTKSLEKLSSDGQLQGYKHEGFWHAMDIIKDKNTLNEMWQTKKAPWKIW